MAMWLPGFLHGSKVSSLTLWGKVPSRGDFIRYNVKHAQSEALQAWIDAHLHVVSTAIEAPVQPTKSKIVKRERAEDAKWSRLTPIDLVDPREVLPKAREPVAPALQQKITPPRAGHAGLPWCFVLPPGSLPFAEREHVIGVWMSSFDKVGRVYPLVMLRTASPRWIKQYFQNHVQQPCDWLFAAARAMAHMVYAEEAALDRPDHPQRQHSEQGQSDHLATLMGQLEQIWELYQPAWLGLFGGKKKSPEHNGVHSFIPAPHPEDPVQRLHGVRYLPWSDWPQRLTNGELDLSQRAAFWQQDLRGRFVGAATRMQDVI